VTNSVSEESYLVESDLCEMLRVAPRTVQRWRYEGTGPAYVRAGGRRVLYRRQDVTRWVESRAFTHRAAELAGCSVPPAGAPLIQARR
jgi:predicted DNA-binding transcriptional regulator AlpA